MSFENILFILFYCHFDNLKIQLVHYIIFDYLYLFSIKLKIVFIIRNKVYLLLYANLNFYPN